MRLLITAIAILQMAGCASIGSTGKKINIGYSLISEEKVSKKTIPELNERHEIHVGDSLLEEFSEKEDSGIEVKTSLDVKGKYHGFTQQYTIRPGFFRVYAKANGGTYFLKKNSVTQYVSASGSYGTYSGGYFVPNDRTKPMKMFYINYNTIEEPINRKVEYSQTKEKTILTDGFRRELVYVGKTGNSIKIEYREFKNNMIRQAFNQTLTYDISNDNVIGYKGALFKIYNATNSSLEYEMLKEFGN